MPGLRAARAPHEGPQTVRTYRFNTREVAEALGAVAAGETYKRASVHIREASLRQGRKDHGQLVADWTEAFAIPLWERYGPDRWPSIVVCDETRFSQRTILGTSHTRWPRTGHEVNALPRVDTFTILAVAGQDGPRAPTRPWFAWAVAGRATRLDWQECFAQLPGRPRLVVADLSPAIFNATDAHWPLDPVTGEAPPRRVYCIHHTKEAFPLPLRVGRAEGTDDPRHDDRRRLLDALNRCGNSEAAWHHFTATARQLGDRERVEKFLARMGRKTVIADQLRLRQHGEPVANAAVEDLVRWLRSAVLGRPFANKERTNRLLRLMVLHRRGHVDTARWSKTIRDHVEAQGGTTAQSLRTMTDPLAWPSLR